MKEEGKREGERRGDEFGFHGVTESGCGGSSPPAGQRGATVWWKPMSCNSRRSGNEAPEPLAISPRPWPTSRCDHERAEYQQQRGRGFGDRVPADGVQGLHVDAGGIGECAGREARVQNRRDAARKVAGLRKPMRCPSSWMAMPVKSKSPAVMPSPRVKSIIPNFAGLILSVPSAPGVPAVAPSKPSALRFARVTASEVFHTSEAGPPLSRISGDGTTAGEVSWVIASICGPGWSELTALKSVGEMASPVRAAETLV